MAFSARGPHKRGTDGVPGPPDSAFAATTLSQRANGHPGEVRKKVNKCLFTHRAAQVCDRRWLKAPLRRWLKQTLVRKTIMEEHRGNNLPPSEISTPSARQPTSIHAHFFGCRACHTMWSAASSSETLARMTASGVEEV